MHMKRPNLTPQHKHKIIVICGILTGDTFLVLLYVQLNRMDSGGSASTSHRTGIECILIAPTEFCSVPGLQRGATAIRGVGFIYYINITQYFELCEILQIEYMQNKINKIK